jgi:hypothetical protein
LPKKAVKSPETVVEHGENGHNHSIEDKELAQLYNDMEKKYIHVNGSGARIVHEEHAPIPLPSGDYEVRVQKQYAPQQAKPAPVPD